MINEISRGRKVRVAEIGVWRGDFAKKMLEGCPNIERYYLVDPWRHLDDWKKPLNVSDVRFEQVYQTALSNLDFAKDRIVVLRGTTLEVIDRIETTLRADFPEDWRALLILDPESAGVSGDAEVRAFRELPDFSEAQAGRICRLVLMQLVPGLLEQDILAFGAALSEIQKIVGDHFAAAQGGGAWTSPAVGRLAERMRGLGAHGIGQSSWGPTGFAFVDSERAAERLYHSLVEEAKADGLDILIARGRNSGATISSA